MAKKASKEEDCECEDFFYLLLFGVTISGPLCLADGFIYLFIGSSIWSNNFI